MRCLSTVMDASSQRLGKPPTIWSSGIWTCPCWREVPVDGGSKAASPISTTPSRSLLARKWIHEQPASNESKIHRIHCIHLRVDSPIQFISDLFMSLVPRFCHLTRIQNEEPEAN